jgi:hypothetical protein
MITLIISKVRHPKVRLNDGGTLNEAIAKNELACIIESKELN